MFILYIKTCFGRVSILLVSPRSSLFLSFLKDWKRILSSPTFIILMANRYRHLIIVHKIKYSCHNLLFFFCFEFPLMGFAATFKGPFSIRLSGQNIAQSALSKNNCAYLFRLSCTTILCQVLCHNYNSVRRYGQRILYASSIITTYAEVDVSYFTRFPT